ncbi:Oligopeptide ABC transporter, ATP-binding protein OppD [[Mycoplasma] cavipharyngis]|uniref:ABC transporter ATP-binding protein n=1 Tax=[Mycoplasma] cavipharyngis TaxID=92757 RepID=UPI003703E4AF
MNYNKNRYINKIIASSATNNANNLVALNANPVTDQKNFINKEVLQSLQKEHNQKYVNDLDAEKNVIVAIRDFSLGFESSLNGKVKQILSNINLNLYAGEKISIIGESGSGKTVLANAIACLLGVDAIKSGSIKVDGIDVVKLSNFQIQKQKIRGQKVSYVFQNPLQTMNPYLQIGTQLLEALKGNKQYKTKAQKINKVLETLRELNLSNPEKIFQSYPHELSGGMIQRVVIACSLLLQPKILILDEPTSALDAVVELQIIDLLNKIVAKGTSVILISHDLKLVSTFSDRIIVLYAGQIVEIGTTKEINLYPQHPYTWGLLMSIPSYQKELYSIPGRVINDLSLVVGDAFASRNINYALAIDFSEKPPMFKISDTHYAASWLLSEHAPSYQPPKPIQELWDAYLNDHALSEAEIKLVDHDEINHNQSKILEIKNMNITYATSKTISKAVHDFSMFINPNEIVGLIGESGSGKSTIAKAIAGLLDFNAIEAKIMGIESPRFASEIVGQVRTRFARAVQMIYQNPASSLNVFKPIWKIVGEALFFHSELLNSKVQELYQREFNAKQNIDATVLYQQINKINYLNGQLSFLKKSIASNQTTFNFELYNSAKSQKKLQKLNWSVKQTKILDRLKQRWELHQKLIKDAQVKRQELIANNKSIVAELNKIKVEVAKENKLLLTLSRDHVLQKKIKSKIHSLYLIKKTLLKHKKKVHRLSDEAIKTFVLQALKKVGLNEVHMKMLSWQLSGGQQQRVAIARNLILKPNLLIADEPIASLDVSLQADIIKLIGNLVKKNNMSTLFISHDLEMLSQIADRIYVLYKGIMVESGFTLDVFANPIHPYTKMLVSSSLNKGYNKNITNVFIFDPNKHYHHDSNEVNQLHQISNQKNHYVFAKKSEVDAWIKGRY